MVTFVLMLAFAGLIYFACEYFVNGIEWLACRMNVGQTAMGTVLAAMGTALPESAVTLVAVLSGDMETKNIGIGAALGGPLVLATLSYATVGIVLLLCAVKLGRTSLRLQLNQERLARDQLWFVSIFAFKILLGLIAFAYKPWTAVFFVAAYILYIRKEMAHADATCEVLEPLKIRPKISSPSLGWIALQVVIALVVIAAASHGFVGQLEKAGPLLGLTPQLTALLFSPLATELPETMNAIIWLRQGKENLALANISGAMMIQATIPSALGIAFTPWMLDKPLALAGVVTMLAILILYSLFRRGKVSGRSLARIGLLYGVFVGGLFAI